jgi:hypothetical protein
MSNPEAVAALLEQAKEELPLVATALKFGTVDVWVRALPFRESMKMRRQYPQDDEDVAQARVLLRCIVDAEGVPLFDYLDPAHIEALLAQKRGSFWMGVSNALTESGEPGKASAQTTSS